MAKEYVVNAMKEFFEDYGIEIGEINRADDMVKITSICGSISLSCINHFEDEFRVRLGSYTWDKDNINLINVEFDFIEE